MSDVPQRLFKQIDTMREHLETMKKEPIPKLLPKYRHSEYAEWIQNVDRILRRMRQCLENIEYSGIVSGVQELRYLLLKCWDVRSIPETSWCSEAFYDLDTLCSALSMDSRNSTTKTTEQKSDELLDALEDCIDMLNLIEVELEKPSNVELILRFEL